MTLTWAEADGVQCRCGPNSPTELAMALRGALQAGRRLGVVQHGGSVCAAG